MVLPVSAGHAGMTPLCEALWPWPVSREVFGGWMPRGFLPAPGYAPVSGPIDGLEWVPIVTRMAADIRGVTEAAALQNGRFHFLPR